MKFINTIILLGITYLPLANANEWYVAQDGLGDCSRAMPCGSVQLAIDKANAFDRIMVGTGSFFENITIAVGKSGLVIEGRGENKTKIVAPDLEPKKFAPANVPIEVVFDVFAPDVVIRDLAIIHPNVAATKRDIGVFIRPSANNVELTDLSIKRLRTGDVLEPYAPGSRGVLVFRAEGVKIVNNKLRGNYEDHVHIPASKTLVKNNLVKGATRLGIVIIQETDTSLSVENRIVDNDVEDNGSDGVQIQGDNNVVMDNDIEDNGGFGIHLCGPMSSPACVAPGQFVSADNNSVVHNELEHNRLGNIVDSGVNNSVIR